MTSLAVAIVLASLLAQPSAAQVPQPTPTPQVPAEKPVVTTPPTAAPTPIPPAPAASAAAAGPWVIGEPKYYRVDETADEVVTSPDNPGHKTDRKSASAYTVKIVPRTLDAGKQAFELTVLQLKLNIPTPMMGEIKIDSTLPDDPKDQMSFHFGGMVKKMIGVTVTVSIEDGLIKEIKGNEAVVDPKVPSAAVVSMFFGDGAISERFAYCLTTGNPAGAAKLEPGATWPVDGKVEFRKLMTIDLPTNAAVKSVKDGLVTIAITPRDGAKMVPTPPAAELFGKIDGTVKENLCSGEIVWQASEDRLQSAAFSTGHSVSFNVAQMKGEQRSVRTLKIMRVDAPTAK